MSKPRIHGKQRVLSASSILKAAGDDLGQIKSDDGLTWADVGRVLGKSEDQAAKYAAGEAEMPLTTWIFARQAWGGRITGSIDRMLAGDVEAATIHDRACETSVLECALKLSIALADDDRIDADEVRRNRATIETARDALDGLLNKLTVRAA